MSRRVGAVATLCATALLAPLRVDAQVAAGLQFEGVLYLYLPSIGGRTNLGESNGGPQIGIDPGKVLDHAKATFMGTLEARQGRWGGFTDLLYVNVGSTKAASTELTVDDAPLPAGASAQLSYELRGQAWTIAGTYRGIPDRDSPVDLLAGVRLLNIRQALAWQISGNVGSIPASGLSGDETVSANNWDVVVGLKGRLTMVKERSWFLPYYFDLGTGESKFTYQTVLGFGWAFAWGEVIGAWRHLDYRMKSGNIDSLKFNGPTVGAAWRW